MFMMQESSATLHACQAPRYIFSRRSCLNPLMDQEPALVVALRALIDASGGHPTGTKAIAATIGANWQTLYQIISGIRLESGKPRNVGNNIASRLDASYPGWRQAHVVSLDIHTVSIPTLAWEKIVAKEPTEPLFKVAVPDDSLAPLFQPKQWIIFSKTRTPKNGKLILVRDKHGQPHIRMRTQGDGPDEWIASAPNPAYRSFVGSEVTVIAAYQGQMEPDD